MSDTTTEKTTTTKAAPAVDWQEATRVLTNEIREHGHPLTGWFSGQQVLLLTTTGARSGERRTTPLAYSRDGDTWVVTASKGGAPEHPAWFHNLRKGPTATVEVDQDTVQVRATVPDGAERQRLWDQHVALHQGIAAYPEKTTRVIPIVVLERIVNA